MAYRHGQRLPLDESAPEGPLLRLSVNPRARRVSVRIDGRSGEAVVTAPCERRLADALAFAKSRAGWIRRRTEARPAARPFTPGATMMFAGRPARLVAAGGAAAARLAESEAGLEIRAGGAGDAFARRVLTLLKREARARLVQRTEVHRVALGQAPVRVAIVDTRSRWGSCSPHSRSIRYSWRVVMAPPTVLDYLAAHEVAHLVRPDHSPAYWAVVESLIGDHRPYRKWLRDNGAALQAVG